MEEVKKFLDCIFVFALFAFFCCFSEFCFAALNVHCHSGVSSLPPLPEHGPTAETAVQELEVKGVDTSPVPYANTLRDEEVDETAEVAENPLAISDLDENRTRKRLQVAPSATSSPAKDAEMKDDGDSGSPTNAHASPLKARPLSSMPPPPVSGGVCFGGPGVFPTLSGDDEEDKFD